MAEVAKGLVVVGRLGVMGSEPLGLYDALADHLDATQHVPALIHEDLHGSGDRSNRQKRDMVDAEMMARTRTSLEAGRSVIFDAYVNSPVKRGNLVELAEGLGAVTVLIHPKARMVEIRERIRERHAADQLYVPNDEVTVDEELRIAKQMMT
ncbi:MAG TPA: AAA family ATPase [Candidatus Saccharimonadales bacterium]|nr:AAA family ATPase [Candidatus Saccharimonadales bacterium]